MTRVRVTPWISSHGYTRVWVRVLDCCTCTTPYPFPRVCGYQTTGHVTLLITLDTATSLPLTPTTTNQMGPNNDNLSSFGPQVSVLYVHYCICSNFFHLL